MKLLLCTACNQIFNLTSEYQECVGGHGGGQYVNNLDAKVWGNKNEIFVLGFANGSLVSALRSQIQLGDSTETMYYTGGQVTAGRNFTAFIIPESASTVVRSESKFEPVTVLDKDLSRR